MSALDQIHPLDRDFNSLYALRDHLTEMERHLDQNGSHHEWVQCCQHLLLVEMAVDELRDYEAKRVQSERVAKVRSILGST